MQGNIQGLMMGTTKETRPILLRISTHQRAVVQTIVNDTEIKPKTLLVTAGKEMKARGLDTQTRVHTLTEARTNMIKTGDPTTCLVHRQVMPDSQIMKGHTRKKTVNTRLIFRNQHCECVGTGQNILVHPQAKSITTIVKQKCRSGKNHVIGLTKMPTNQASLDPGIEMEDTPHSLALLAANLLMRNIDIPLVAKKSTEMPPSVQPMQAISLGIQTEVIASHILVSCPALVAPPIPGAQTLAINNHIETTPIHRDLHCHNREHGMDLIGGTMLVESPLEYQTIAVQERKMEVAAILALLLLIMVQGQMITEMIMKIRDKQKIWTSHQVALLPTHSLTPQPARL